MGAPNKLVRHDTLCPPEYWATAVDPKNAKNQWLGVMNVSRCLSASRSAAFRPEFGTNPSPEKRKKKALSKTPPALKDDKKKAARK